MQEECVVGAVGDEFCGGPAESPPPEAAAGEVTEEEVARLPDATVRLPENMWLYAIPVILLLFLLLFYPVILVLICIILALWWLD